MITKREIEYEGFGKCLELTNGTIRLAVTLDFGPRIIHFSFIDGENVMFTDPERNFKNANDKVQEKFGGTWYTYGGHRLWASPEGNPKSYYPDNEPVSYILTDNGVIVTPPEQKWNLHQHQMEIAMADDGPSVSVTHRITNKGAWDITLAPWSITVLAPGGVEIIPQPTKNTGLLPNRWLGLWPYAKMTDPRVTWGDRYIFLKQDANIRDKFKLGISSEHGYSLYFNHGEVFVKQFDSVEGATYPDGGMNFETYVNRLFLEMESLGVLQTLAPEETAQHIERWSLYKEDMPELSEEAIDKVVEKYVR
ncbi:MAG: hypothetical protein E7403_03815 [Ruminococcaceae bacterium]|nr:hypothetical protein [Oscillospiraceae bacterium]